MLRIGENSVVDSDVVQASFTTSPSSCDSPRVPTTQTFAARTRTYNDVIRQKQRRQLGLPQSSQSVPRVSTFPQHRPPPSCSSRCSSSCLEEETRPPGKAKRPLHPLAAGRPVSAAEPLSNTSNKQRKPPKCVSFRNRIQNCQHALLSFVFLPVSATRSEKRRPGNHPTAMKLRPHAFLIYEAL